MKRSNSPSSKNCNSVKSNRSNLFERFSTFSDDVFDDLDGTESVNKNNVITAEETTKFTDVCKTKQLLDIFGICSDNDSTENIAPKIDNQTNSSLQHNFDDTESNDQNWVTIRNDSYKSTESSERFLKTSFVKPKFPGPAGLLPDVYTAEPRDEDKDAERLLLQSDDSKTKTEVPKRCSLGPLWQCAVRDLELALDDDECIINRYNVKKSILQLNKANSASSLRRIPVLLLQVNCVTPSPNQTSLVCSDHTGEVCATVSQSASKEYCHLLSIGSVLLLSKVTVWRCSMRAPILAITMENISALYTAQSSELKVSEQLNVQITSSLTKEQRVELKNNLIVDPAERSLVEENSDHVSPYSFEKVPNPRFAQTFSNNSFNSPVPSSSSRFSSPASNIGSPAQLRCNQAIQRPPTGNSRGNANCSSPNNYSVRPRQNIHSIINFRTPSPIRVPAPQMNRNVPPNSIRPLMSSNEKFKFSSNKAVTSPSVTSNIPNLSQNLITTSIAQSTNNIPSKSSNKEKLFSKFSFKKEIPQMNSTENNQATPTARELKEINELMQTFANEDFDDF